MTLEKTIDTLEKEDRNSRSSFIENVRFGEAPDFSNLSDERVVSQITSGLRFLRIPVDDTNSYSKYEQRILKRINSESIRDIASGMYDADHTRKKLRLPRGIMRALFLTLSCGSWLGLYVSAGIGTKDEDPSKKIVNSDHTLYGIIFQYGRNGMNSVKDKNRHAEFNTILPYEREIKRYLHPQTSRLKPYIHDLSPEQETNADYNNILKKTLSHEFGNSGSNFGGHGGGSYTL